VTVTTTPSNVAAGQTIVWGVTVTGSGSYPTGSIAFTLTGTSGTVATVPLPASTTTAGACTTTCSNSVSYTYTVPANATAGSYTVTATYLPVNEQYPTASGTGIYNVAANTTTSVLTANPTTFAFNASTVLTDVISWPTTTVTGPTGTVKLSSSLTQEGTFQTLTVPSSACVVSLSAKTATCTYTWTPTYGGAQTISAVYSGDTNYAGSTGTTAITVTQNSTTTALTINPSTVTDVNVGTTFTSVTTYTSSTTPTGTVVIGGGLGTLATFSVSACTVNTSAKTITCAYNNPNAWNVYENGTYTITATYSGDAGDAGSTGSATFVVAGEDTDTTAISLATTGSTYATGGTSVATITLTGHNADGNPTGTLTVTGSGTLGTLATITLPTATNSTCTLARAKFVCTATLTIPAGTAAAAYTITASYSGDVNYLPSTGTATYTIAKATPTAAAGNVSGAYESTVTLSATDTGVTHGVAPTGTVTFKVNSVTVTGTPSCSGSGVVETCTLSYALPAGLTPNTYPITAVFATDTNYNASNTASATLTVTNDTASFGTMTFSPAATETQGTNQAITISDTLTFSGPKPTGAVTYVLNGVTYTATCGSTSPATCTATVPGATIAALAANTYTVTAALAAGGGYAATTGASGTFTITAALTASFGTMSFSPAASEPQGTNQAITISDTLTFSGAKPSGAVTYVLNGVTYTATCGSTSPATCTATVPGATIAALAANSYTVTAALAAGGGYSATTGTSGTFTITAAGGNITFTSVSHNFGSEAVGTAAPNYSLNLTNGGTTAFPFAIVFTPANGFTEYNNCGTSVAVGATCTILFEFTPTATGTVTASWSMTPQTGFTFSPSNGGTLTGTGITAAGVTLTTNGHNFGSVPVGTTSGVYGTVLTNSTSAAVTLSIGSVTSPFVTYINNCPASLASGASCNLQFEFAPTATGTVQQVFSLSASTTITSGGAPLPNGGITLTGTGQ
jgi:hypothetical protein